MSWELAEKLRARFPEIELFPRPGHEPAGGTAEAPPVTEAPAAPAGQAEGEAGAAVPIPTQPAPARRPAHEQPPAYLTPGVIVPKERLLEICRVLATDPEFALAYLSFVTAIDRPEAGEFDILYHAYAHQTRLELALKVRVPRDRPAVPSVTGIWDGANWHEREAFDLFGIIFEGHPNLRRIMMTDDWIGHPLRKDYTYQDPAWLVEVARQRKKETDGFGLGERA